MRAMLLLWLVCTLVTAVMTQMHGGSGLRKVYLPANEISHDLEVARYPRTRIYDFRATTIRLSFNAARCHHHSEHLIILSFFDYWTPPDLMNKNHLFSRAYIIEKTERKRGEFIVPIGQEAQMNSGIGAKIHRRKKITKSYSYRISSIRTGNAGAQMSEDVEFTDEKGHVYISIDKQISVLRKYLTDKEPEQFQTRIVTRLASHFSANLRELYLNTTGVKYFALFATNMANCPAFISAVDNNFDVWLSGDKMDVQGLRTERAKTITVFRDVVLAGAVILRSESRNKFWTHMDLNQCISDVPC